MKRKLWILVILLLMVLSTGGFINYKYFHHQSELKVDNQIPTSVLSPTISPQTSVPKSTESPLPASYIIENFPFQSQAPLGDWDELHDEACEEAALILVNYYLNQKPLNAEIMDAEIQKMVAWEVETFGSHKDLTLEELAEIADQYYHMTNYNLKNNVDIDDIKTEIAQGHPVIIPTAGRLLGNPYFRSPGPIYHMLVVIGYEGNNIIVQDIGTRRGNYYTYNQKVLLNALHDWTGNPETIDEGSKAMLVFY